MKHEDFLKLYENIRVKEVAALNAALEKFPSQKYMWRKDEKPIVTASPRKWEEQDQALVAMVKLPITQHGGIVIQSRYDFEAYTVGYEDLAFGDISEILTSIPTLNEYQFSWDGGCLPNRHQSFSFESEEQAKSEALQMKDKYHIDTITVYHITGTVKNKVATF